MKKLLLKRKVNETLPMKDKGGDIYILLSPKNTGNENMIMGYAITPSGTGVKEHKHPKSEECFFVIKGKGRVFFENGEVLDFEEHDAVRIPRNVKHAIENTGDNDLCVVFASGPLAKTMESGHEQEDKSEK